jgi:hypothetical protein
MTNYQTIIRGALCGLILAGAYLVSGDLNAVNAQRDPFAKPALNKKYLRANKPAEPVIATPPTIEERIAAFRAKKIAAMNAGVPADKPTTILLLSEMEVTGIFRTPRGYAAMVEATPLTTAAPGSKTAGSKLSYVVYPGEMFFDGQLVAIEETRLVFRKNTRWTNGKVDRSVESKTLRLPNAVTDGLQSTRQEDNAAPKTEEPRPPQPANPAQQ